MEDWEKDARADYALDTEVWDLSKTTQDLLDYLDSLTVPEDVDRDVVLGFMHEITGAYVNLAAKLDLRAKELIDY